MGFGIGLLTGGWGPTFTTGTVAGGASGTVFYFTLEDDAGALAPGITLSTSEFQVSVNGAAFANRAGSAPTSIGSGAYYYILDNTENVQGTILFKVDKTGYKPTGQPQIYTMKIDTPVTDAQNFLNNAITNAITTLSSTISAAITSINSHTDSELASAITSINTHTDERVDDAQADIIAEIDGRPTAAEIDTQLSSTHGAGAWGTAGLDVNAIVTAVFAALIEGSVTFGDAVRALLSLNGGPVGDFNTGTLVFKSLNGAKTRLTITTDDSGRLVTTIGDLSP